MPDKDHPVWKAVQSAFAVVALIVLVWHVQHPVPGGIDADAVVGTGGLAVATKLIWQALKG